MKTAIQFLSKKNNLLLVYILIAIGIALQLHFIDKPSIGSTFKAYNNYHIFKWSFSNLIHHSNLYIEHLEQYGDLYKYSPTFAVLFAPLSAMPNLLGLMVWELLSFVVVFFAINNFEGISQKKKAAICIFILLELISSNQNTQSNALIIGLMLLAFNSFEKEKLQWAALFIVLTFFIKIYGAAIGIIFLLYPNKLKFIGWSAFWFCVLLLLPLFFISPHELIWQYNNWFELLKNDQANSWGISVMGFLHGCFNIAVPKTLPIFIGFLLLVFPIVLTIKKNVLENRINIFCAVVLWLIIFNHRSESPTFIIAVCAVAIWFFFKAIPSKIDWILLLLTFIFTSLITTDILPIPNKRIFMEVYSIKAIPCFWVWVKILFDFYFPTLKNQSSISKKSISPNPLRTN